MSLQIWLPLNEDIHNQGLMNISFTNSNAVINNNGKIGKCYYFDISENSMIKNNNDIPTNNWSQGSLCCWVKLNTFPNDSTNPKWAPTLFLGTSGLYANSIFGLVFEYSNYINISIHGSTTGKNAYKHNLITDTWYHICTTYDGSIVKLYINGQEVMSKTATLGTFNSDLSTLYVGGNPNYILNGYLNDCRYYDHCLSAKEVEEISKGLILHYKLDNNGYNNLLTSTVSRTVTIPDEATNAYTAYWYFNTDIKNNHLFENNPKYTVTYDYIVNNLSESSTSAYVYSQLNTSRSNPVVSQTGFRTNTNGHVIETFTVDDTQKAYSSTFRFRIRLQSANPGDSITISNLRIYLCDQNEINYVSDSSGYNNNGNIIGYLLSNENSIKYNSSLFQDNGLVNYIKTKEKIYIPTDTITMNIWIKSTNITPKGNYHNPFCAYTTPASFEMSIHKTGYLRGGFHISGTRVCDNCTSLKLLDGNWHMITITYDGIAIKKYVDAILEKTTTATGTLTSPMDFAFGRYGSGTTYSSNDMTYSDARIYATALTELQIKELYNISMSIDNNGNTYIRELVE